MATPNKSNPAQPGATPSPISTNTKGQPAAQVPHAEPSVRVEVNAPQHQAPAPTMHQQRAARQATPSPNPGDAQVAVNPVTPATQTQQAPQPAPQSDNGVTRGLPGDGPTTRPDAGGQDPKNPTPAAQSVGGQPPAGAQVNPGASTPTPTSKG